MKKGFTGYYLFVWPVFLSDLADLLQLFFVYNLNLTTVDCD